MLKVFNTTGVCIPERHYMVDITERLRKIKEQEGMLVFSNSIFKDWLYEYYLKEQSNKQKAATPTMEAVL